MPLNALRDLLKLNTSRRSSPITVVSGLPRSGTSLMMKMLEAGGIPPLTDNERRADDDNPKGYYEFERVKKLDKGDTAWLADAPGKAVKVIAALLPHLPADYTYRVVFMRRAMPEILASQKTMLVNRGMDASQVSDEQMSRLFDKHLQVVEAWMASRRHVTSLDVNYNALLENPAPHVETINAFLGGILDTSRMIQTVDPNLYRQRR
jgi:hypothetical protein